MRFIIFKSLVKPYLVKYFKWFLEVIEGEMPGKGHILILDQTEELARILHMQLSWLK